MPNIADIDRCIQTGIYEQTFSGAACIASVKGEIFHRAMYGTPTFPPPYRKLDFDAVFDLASLTKPLATGLMAMVLASRSRIDLNAQLARVLPEFRDSPLGPITLDMLLDHSGGFPATRDFYQLLADRDAKKTPVEKISATRKAWPLVREELCTMEANYEPGTKSVYSDVGFIVLGLVLEAVVQQPLDVFLEREVYKRLGLEKDLFFVRLDDERARKAVKSRNFVATEQCARRDKLLVGEVHDPSAWALGGVAGHAGLFGTVDGVWKLVNALWQSYNGDNAHFLGGTVRRFFTRSKRVANTTRALAWDTPTVSGSQAGKRFSLSSVGHLGFTGCSVWLDLNSGVLGVFLANAVHPTVQGKSEAMAKLRPKLYELIAKHGDAFKGQA